LQGSFVEQPGDQAGNVVDVYKLKELAWITFSGWQQQGQSNVLAAHHLRQTANAARLPSQSIYQKVFDRCASQELRTQQIGAALAHAGGPEAHHAVSLGFLDGTTHCVGAQRSLFVH
jgi:hypothetical protein